MHSSTGYFLHRFYYVNMANSIDNQCSDQWRLLGGSEFLPDYHDDWWSMIKRCHTPEYTTSSKHT